MRIIFRFVSYICIGLALVSAVSLVSIDDEATSWIACALIALGCTLLFAGLAIVTYDIYTTIGAVYGIRIVVERLLFRYTSYHTSRNEMSYDIVCKCGGFWSTIKYCAETYKEFKESH